MTDQACPCGSRKVYGDCCGLYHNGTPAPTAVALMRSRYTAYAQSNVDYLQATLHPSKRQFDDRINILKSFKETHWQHLRILSTRQGKPTDELGYVEFVAVYQTHELGQLHERSRFVKAEGHWFYIDGKQLPPWRPKRSEPCWCGSGQKFKQCHGQGRGS